jgi:hypothetical protein
MEHTLKITRRKTLHGVGGAIAAAFLFTAGGPALAAGKPSDAYAYPIQPGTPAWATLQAHSEMVAVTQIPEDTLRAMSTAGLVESVLNYPLFSDLLLFNSTQQGFEVMAGRFNGMQELLARKDAGKVLLATYRAMDPHGVPAGSLEAQGAYDARFTRIETLLAQDAIIANLSRKERQELLTQALAKFDAKAGYKDVYGQFGKERSALVLGRTLRQEKAGWPKQESTVLRRFLDDGSVITEPAVEGIAAEARRFLAGDTTGGNESYTEDYNTTIYTPLGSPVTGRVQTYELSSAQIAEINASVQSGYPAATRETNSSRLYNCHSYAWHNQSTSNNIWLNTPGDDTYWLDGSYTQIPYSYVLAGDPLSYTYGDHSGRMASFTTVRSKWGSGPRMVHAPTYSPYDSSTLRYFMSATGALRGDDVK